MQEGRGNCAIAAVLWLFLLSHCCQIEAAKHSWSSSRKSPTSSSSGHVTKPSYSTSGSNSHADVAKLSYPNYNSQPNRASSAGSAAGGAQNAAPIGWNVPSQHGPPPAYSASNPVGGAKTNFHEPPPSYHSNNNAAPPSYNAATGGHPSYHSPGQLPAGATYHSPGNLPAGATYHSPGNLPAGATYHSPGNLPAGATYHSPGSQPAGAYYPSAGQASMGGGGGYYPQGGHMPAYGGGHYPAAGATYLPAGAALPPGATYYPQAPQQSSSGLGFGSGLAAGALGGALLGHVLTPTQTRVVEAAPAAAAPASDGDRIIIINNGQPLNASDVSGATVVNAAAPAVAAAPVDGGNSTAAGVPAVPLAPIDAAATGAATDAAAPGGPAPGSIICVPMQVNETDPADPTKVVLVEKIACYPAPPPVAAPSVEGNGTVPLAPMNAAPGDQQQQKQAVVPEVQSGAALAKGQIGIFLIGLALNAVLVRMLAWN